MIGAPHIGQAYFGLERRCRSPRTKHNPPQRIEPMTAPAHPVLCVAQAHWRTLLDCDWRAPLPAFDANSRSTTAPLASASRALTSHVGLARRARLACRQGGGHHGGVHVMVSGSETWICFTVAARVSILTSHIPPPPPPTRRRSLPSCCRPQRGIAWSGTTIAGLRRRRWPWNNKPQQRQPQLEMVMPRRRPCETHMLFPVLCSGRCRKPAVNVRRVTAQLWGSVRGGQCCQGELCCHLCSRRA